MGCGVNVISDEDFSTSDNINIEEKSLRIKKIFPLAKIIVVVRSPETLIRSFYHHCFRSGITNVNFNNWFEEELKNYNNSMILQTAHYGKCIKSFVKNFGQDNVCVLNLEDLKNNKNLFMSSLYKYMGLQYIKQENKITKRNESLPIGAIQFGIEYPFLWRFRFYIPRFVRRVIKFVFTKVEVKINTNNLNSKNRRYINDMYLNDIRYLESEFNIIFK